MVQVKQRTGRIDRVGQRHATIRVVTLSYEGTVETVVYRALRRGTAAIGQGRGAASRASRPAASASALSWSILVQNTGDGCRLRDSH